MGHQAPDVELPAVFSIDPSSSRRPPAGSALALRNWRVTWRLIALIVIPTMMGLIFGGLRVAAADNTASQFGQVRQLALLGQQVTGLVQALEDERDLTAGYVAAGRPAARFTQLRKQYAVTDAWAARAGSMANGIGAAYPAQTQAKAGVVLARLSDLAGLRATAASNEPEASPLITGYSTTISQLLAFNDEIAQDSANSVLADTVRTLNSLSEMKDDASQQRGLLYAALIERQFELGAPNALTAAQAQEDSDQSAFEASATLAEQHLYDSTVTGPPMDLAEVLEQLMVDSNTPDVANVSASQWYPSMTDTIDRMRIVEERLAASAVAQSQTLEQGAERSALLTVFLSLALLLLALVATLIVARSMVRPLRVLRSDALEIATVRLPEKVRELSDADDTTPLGVTPVSVHSSDEIGEVARAFDQVHMEAVRLAANEAMLRNNMNAMFVSLSRRSQSLLERLARVIDSLEQREDDPGRLSNLFTMDHLVTRMRRHSENLLVLAGHEPARKRAEPVALTDVVRAAVSEIQQYNRVMLNIQANVAISGQSVNDVVHLLAEIIENATLFSAGDSPIRVTGQHLSTGGMLLDVTDSGIGIPAERLAQLNWRLDNPPLADVSVSRHMGLFAVAHLAARHGVRVRLRPAVPRGLTALVWIPETLITAAASGTVGWAGAQTARLPEDATSMGGGWYAFGRHRSSRKMVASTPAGYSPDVALGLPDPPTGLPDPSPGLPDPPVGLPDNRSPADAEDTVPLYEPTAAGWFLGGGVPAARGPGAGQVGAWTPPNWDSPADAGWHAAESAATPVRGQLTSAGLPQRIPRANIVPGSAGERARERPRQAPADDHPVTSGTPRSADAARNRLAGLQRGTRRAEDAVASHVREPADG